MTPAELVTRCKSSDEKEHFLFLVTGKIGSGKTSWCLELARQARAAGLAPVGLISPGVYERGVKIAIDLMEIETGERRRLAFHRNQACQGTLQHLVSLTSQRWLFDPDVLDWGNHVLAGLQPARLLILDELGPLEFLENIGLIEGIGLVDRRGFPVTCVVIRPKLLSNATELWPWAQILRVTGESWESGNDPG